MRKVTGIVVLAAFALLGGVQGAFADDGDRCFTDLGHCYEAAAAIESFWYRWAAGLDCELDLVECVREKLLGY